jgi:hypothetical protein
VYGGRFGPSTYTKVIVDEIQRYAEGRHALTICLPRSEYSTMTLDDLRAIDKNLGSVGRLVLVDEEEIGRPASAIAEEDLAAPRDIGRSLSAMRAYVARQVDARVLVGGKLNGYQGTMPGVIEEAITSLVSAQPIYVAGGFGGAAALVARVLTADAQTWAPANFPNGMDDESLRFAVDQLNVAAESGVVPDGLTDEERSQLASTHRPGDIATLVALGLARVSEAGAEQ